MMSFSVLVPFLYLIIILSTVLPACVWTSHDHLTSFLNSQNNTIWYARKAAARARVKAQNKLYDTLDSPTGQRDLQRLSRARERKAWQRMLVGLDVQ